MRRFFLLFFLSSFVLAAQENSTAAPEEEPSLTLAEQPDEGETFAITASQTASRLAAYQINAPAIVILKDPQNSGTGSYIYPPYFRPSFGFAFTGGAKSNRLKSVTVFARNLKIERNAKSWYKAIDALAAILFPNINDDERKIAINRAFDAYPQPYVWQNASFLATARGSDFFAFSISINGAQPLIPD